MGPAAAAMSVVVRPKGKRATSTGSNPRLLSNFHIAVLIFFFFTLAAVTVFRSDGVGERELAVLGGLRGFSGRGAFSCLPNWGRGRLSEEFDEGREEKRVGQVGSMFY